MEKVDKNKKKKKKRKILLISLISLAIILIAGGIVTLIIFLNKNKLSENEAKNMLQDNYLISYIIEGDIKTSDSYITVDDTNQYYLVTDPRLENIKSLSDIETLIRKNITTAHVPYVTSLMNGEDGNVYFEFDKHLFVKKISKKCYSHNAKLKMNETFLVREKGKYYINYGYDGIPVTFSIYTDELDEKKFKFNSLLFSCGEEGPTNDEEVNNEIADN